MKITLRSSVFILLTLSLSSLSFAIEEDELGCIIGECVNGRGTLVSISSHGETRYAGNFKDGQYNGYGEVTYVEEGVTYKGAWLLGKKQGRGKLWDKAKNVYIGNWRNDRRNGQGTQVFKYEGWVENEHGESWLLENTENYTGEFKNDTFSGQGAYRWADGSKYIGSWVGSKKHGEGYFDFGNNVRSYRNFEYDVKVFDDSVFK